MGNEANRAIVQDANDNRTWSSGIDPLEDVQIATASKKRFMEWWKFHTTAYPVRAHKGVVDSGKIVRMSEKGFDIIGATFKVNDYMSEQMPFRMNAVDSFIIEMPQLTSFKNCPKYCKASGQFGSSAVPMHHTDSLIGCPQRINSLTVHTRNMMTNLETSLQGEVESLSIYTPGFSSFAGLTARVRQLNLGTWKQRSFKGIHRDIHNIEVLTIGLWNDSEHEVGVLPFAMMDERIAILPDAMANAPLEWIDALRLVNQSRIEGLNVHDIQERLIDAGFGKYAKL